MEHQNINGGGQRIVNKDNFAFLHPLRVRWNECDMHGIVFNVNYFLYYDIAMYEWQRAIGHSEFEHPDFITVHAQCDYLASARFDDELHVGIRCAGLGSKSLNLETAIFRGTELLNCGKLVYAHVLKGQTVTSALGADFIQRVMAFEKLAPLQATVGGSG